MDRKRILFVDDEQSLLDGLQNLLRRQRGAWDMVFKTNGADALEALRAAPFDVIVTDMRMPGMDGAALLERVKHDHPGVARLVLSGYADREALTRAVAVAHQFISKPCNADTLRSVVERTCGLQDLLADETLRQLVGQLDTLPSVPRTYLALSDALRGGDVGSLEIAAIIEWDPAMSVKVLQLVNSAYFGLAQRVVSIQQAVMYLGLDLVKGLALTAHVFAAVEPEASKRLSLDALQDHVVLTARLAGRMVTDPAHADEAFTAAMVHHVGEIVLACGRPSQFAAASEQARTTGRSLEELEADTFGVPHSAVGAYLLGVWGLPFPIVEAVAYHGTPSRVSSGARDVLAAVHVANAFAISLAAGTFENASDHLDLAFLEGAGVLEKLPTWRKVAMQVAEKATWASGPAKTATTKTGSARG